VVLPILTAVAGDSKNFLARTFELLWGLMVCIYGISHVPALLMVHIAGYKGRLPLLVVFLLLVAQASDVLQYIWGKLIGTHKIAPAVSPSKAVEGFLGGAASATALGAALWWMTPFTIIQAGGMAFVITLAGFIGGLVLSAVKRDRGIKDWSRLIPGHGGMLDQVDSICFSAPVFSSDKNLILPARLVCPFWSRGACTALRTSKHTCCEGRYALPGLYGRRSPGRRPRRQRNSR